MARVHKGFWIVVCVGLMIAAAVYVVLSGARTSRLAELVSAEAASAQNLIAHDLKVRVDSIERMADHWQHFAEAEGSASHVFEHDAELIMNDMPGFRAVALIGSDAMVRLVHPPPLQKMIGANFTDLGQERRRLFDAVVAHRKTFGTKRLNLRDGSGSGFLILTPVVVGDDMRSAILVVFNFEVWLENIYFGAGAQTLSNLEIQVMFDDAVVYETGAFAQTGGVPAQASGGTVLGRELSLRAKPRDVLVARSASILPEVIALLIAMMAGAVSVVRYALERSRLAAADTAAANAELRRSNQRLSNQIDHRRAAEAKAHQASEAKSQFLRSVSHEIRTPMNGALGLTALLQQTKLTDRQSQMLDTVASSGKALLSVINDVLDFSRIEAGEMRMKARPLNLSACIEDVVRLIGSGHHSAAGDAKADPKRGPIIEISMIGNAPLMVLADGDRVRQMLINLIGNAVKFTAQGVIKVTAGFDAEMVTIEVQDTGIGIPSDKLSCIFDEFRQVDGDENRAYGGTGLGLAITKRIATTMGGDVNVSSVLGEGATFVLTFPYVPVECHQAPDGISHHAAA